MRRSWLLALVGALVTLLVGCPNDKITDVTSPTPIYKFYTANHWIPLPEPDSRFGPGAVFTYSPQNGFSWQGNITTCGLPKEIVTPTQGAAGKLTFNSTSDYGASAVLKIGGVQAGPDFSKVKKVSLELDNHGPDSLDMLSFRLWVNDPSNKDKIPQTCKDILNTPNTYVVQEAYAVSKGKFTLDDKNNAKISLTGLQAGPVNISAGAHAAPSADGSLEFDQTLYTAVRRLQYANGDWQSLGHANPDADQQLLNQLSYVKP